MIQEDTKTYIDDRIRLATDSSNQAMTNMLGFLQSSNQEIRKTLEHHKEDEVISRDKARMEMRETVRDEIKITVNGKLDKQDIKIDDTKKSIEEVKKILENMNEMQQNYNDFKTTKKTLKSYILPVTAALITLGAVTTSWSSIIEIFK